MIRGDILFIYGAPRSGTTYLNALIREYFDFGLCAEADFILRFRRRLWLYGDLRRERNLKRLISAICQDNMLEHFRTVYSKFAGRQVDVQPLDVLDHLSERTYPGIIYAVLLCVAEQLNRTRVGNKNPDFYRCLPQLLAWFPNAKFIRIVRDGRDVALSTMKEPWGEQSAFACAQKWVRVERTAIDFEGRVDPDRCLVLRYESLLTAPASSFDQLETFLGAPATDGTKDGFVAEIETGGKRGNFGKWKREMTRHDLNIFEAVAGSWLARYGYERAIEKPKVSIYDCSRDVLQEYSRRLKTYLGS